MVQWVEQGNVPDAVPAVARLADALRERPLYAYPTVTRYLGGDVNRAGSFAPAAPNTEPADGFPGRAARLTPQGDKPA
jgi:feruloyl esterase